MTGCLLDTRIRPRQIGRTRFLAFLAKTDKDRELPR